jgi:hypothetical protein
VSSQSGSDNATRSSRRSERLNGGPSCADPPSDDQRQVSNDAPASTASRAAALDVDATVRRSHVGHVKRYDQSSLSMRARTVTSTGSIRPSPHSGQSTSAYVSPNCARRAGRTRWNAGVTLASRRFVRRITGNLAPRETWETPERSPRRACDCRGWACARRRTRTSTPFSSPRQQNANACCKKVSPLTGTIRSRVRSRDADTFAPCPTT